MNILPPIVSRRIDSSEGYNGALASVSLHMNILPPIVSRRIDSSEGYNGALASVSLHMNILPPIVSRRIDRNGECEYLFWLHSTVCCVL